MAVTISQEAGIIRMTAAADSVTGAYFVKSWRWVGDAIAAGDDLSITDPVTGEVLVETVASGADYAEEALVERWWRNGATVTTMSAGTFYLHYL